MHYQCMCITSVSAYTMVSPKIITIMCREHSQSMCHVHIYVCDFICMGRDVNGVLHVCNSTVNTLTHHNLPHDLVVNSCSMAPKARRVPVILINTTDQNIWVRQLLLATELYEAEVEPQQYHTDFYSEGHEITIPFLLAPPHKRQKQVENNTVEVEENPDPPKKNKVPVEHPRFGERSDTEKAYDLKTKLSSYHLSLI